MTLAAGFALLQVMQVGAPRMAADSGPAEPDTVLVAPGQPSFAARWQWAESAARNARIASYWIGWAIEGDTTGRMWYYFDRRVPTRPGERGSGTQLEIGGFIGGIGFSGVKPGSLVGHRDPHEIVVLLRYEQDGGRVVLARMHASNLAFPVHFGGGALLWLGRANDAESVERLRTLFAGEPAFRRDLVTAVGVHRNSDAAVPALRGWLEGRDSTGIRRAAAQWLGHHPHAMAVDALTRAIRTDTSGAVRSQAARSLARAAPASAAVDALARVAREDSVLAVRRAAVQALGEIRDDRAVRALAALIEQPGDTRTTDVRKEAVATIGRRAARTGPTPRETVELLLRVARTDPDQSVQVQAVESLIALPGAASIPVLLGIANEHRDARVQQRAVQGIPRSEPAAEAAAALRRIAWEHPHSQTQSAAVRALAQLGTDEARRLLAEIAERHSRPEIRRAALQSIVQLEVR